MPHLLSKLLKKSPILHGANQDFRLEVWMTVCLTRRRDIVIKQSIHTIAEEHAVSEPNFYL